MHYTFFERNALDEAGSIGFFDKILPVSLLYRIKLHPFDFCCAHCI